MMKIAPGLLVHPGAFSIGKTMLEFIWRGLARIASRPAVADWIIARAQRTPYLHLTGYMDRWWLLNPYGKDAAGNQTPAVQPWLPSVRVHHIVRPDDDAHEHNHPWVARSVILRGSYVEERRNEYDGGRLRERGFTQQIMPSVFHRITEVSAGGAYTLFLTWGESQGWGFDVDGRTVPWRQYLELDC